MVRQALIGKRKTDRFVMPPGIAQFYHGFDFVDVEDGLVEVVLRPGPRPPVGYHACFEGCQTFTLHNWSRCAWGNCSELYCAVCGRHGYSDGPVGCPCSDGRRGHHTRAEQTRPSAGRFRKVRR